MNVELELKNVEQTLWRIQDICPYGSEVDLAVRDAIRAVRNAITTEHEYRTGIKSSKKPIKSSLEDRLVPYLEEFEEGYADALTSTDEMGPEVRLDTFYEIFKSDHNLSDDDIDKLKDSVEGIWEESKEM